MKRITRFVAFFFLMCSFAAIFSACGGKKYRLTVEDPNEYLIEKLKKRYAAGETVTVKTTILYDAGLSVYLDGVALDHGLGTSPDGYTHWEYYFVMPAHDAVLTFEVFGGW